MDFIKNEKRRRFELDIDGQTAYIDFYQPDSSKIYLTHIEVPKELEGQGIASRLTKRTFQYIDSNKLALIPQCPFIKSYIQKHPEYKTLLDASVEL